MTTGRKRGRRGYVEMIAFFPLYNFGTELVLKHRLVSWYCKGVGVTALESGAWVAMAIAGTGTPWPRRRIDRAHGLFAMWADLEALQCRSISSLCLHRLDSGEALLTD